MPSAKCSFALSSLKLSKGKTAIDLSIACAASRGKIKEPTTLASDQSDAPRTNKFRRFGRSAGGQSASVAIGAVRWIPCGPHQTPSQNQRDRKTREHADNDEPQNRRRQISAGKVVAAIG